jgi:hypothetical protein
VSQRRRAARSGQLRRIRDSVPSLLSTQTHQFAKMGDVIKETLNVAGLLTNVYGRSTGTQTNSPAEPIVVLFVLHGRGDSADVVDSTARAAFAWVDDKQASSSSSKRGPTPRDFIVVTFVRGFPSHDLIRAPLAGLPKMYYDPWVQLLTETSWWSRCHDFFFFYGMNTAGPAESWSENSGRRREPGMESQAGKT